MSSPKRVAVLQSSYIPWKGYFDLIHDVDTFIFYDDVQFTRQDWRSRNRIVTRNGLLWLTVPAGSDINRNIDEVTIRDSTWQRKHWASISQSYARAPHFKEYSEFFSDLYLGRTWTSLSEMNQYFIRAIANLLGIEVEFRLSTEYRTTGKKLDRLLDLLVQVGATTYISGPAARAYINPIKFDDAGIELMYKDYTGYPEYPQLGSGFEHAVSIIDLIFNTGHAAPRYIWGWRQRTASRPVGPLPSTTALSNDDE